MKGERNERNRKRSIDADGVFLDLQVVVLFALVTLAFAEETKNDGTKVESTKKDKRGLYGALGYGIGGLSYGYGLGGLSSYSALPIGLSHGVSTVLTKEVAVPVPQPVAVPVEKHVPVPVKVIRYTRRTSFRFSYSSEQCSIIRTITRTNTSSSTNSTT